MSEIISNQPKPKCIINSITTTPLGVIKAITLYNTAKESDKTQSFNSIAELKHYMQTQNLKLHNTEITDTNTIITTYENFRKMQFKQIDKPVKYTEVTLDKVIYSRENTLNVINGMNIVDEIYISTTSTTAKENLLYIGLEIYKVEAIQKAQEIIQKYTFKIESIKLKHLINKSLPYRNLFLNFRIDLLFSTYLIIKDTNQSNQNNIQYVEINTPRENYIKWKQKAKIIGIFEDYEVDEEKLYLKSYTGKDINISIPPVRIANLLTLTQSQKVKLPSTVYKLTSQDSIEAQHQKIKELEFSPNLASVPSEILLCIGDNITLPELDTQNLLDSLVIKRVHKLVYRTQYGSHNKLRFKIPPSIIEIKENIW